MCWIKELLITRKKLLILALFILVSVGILIGMKDYFYIKNYFMKKYMKIDLLHLEGLIINQIVGE
ncbi:hypothetical protein AFK71_12180 [Virgibacillus pantothenticus]|uniref:Uncharacterized protein n=1 Tax=Virgibacillus pantothenticus TaxID=1473 RepID=A0A0L0QL77_VIRPA|nr:hypothetical protein AFK71_12180 [Virgibacillus pantothenticus]